MVYWIIGGTLAVLMLGVVVVAVRAEPPLTPPAPRLPDWVNHHRPQLTAEAVADVQFRLAMRGYDRHAVDTYVAAVGRAFREATESPGVTEARVVTPREARTRFSDASWRDEQPQPVGDPMGEATQADE